PPPSTTLFPYTTLFRSLPESGIPHRATLPASPTHQPMDSPAAALATSSSRRRPPWPRAHTSQNSWRHQADHQKAPLAHRLELQRSEEHTSELQSRFDLV